MKNKIKPKLSIKGKRLDVRVVVSGVDGHEWPIARHSYMECLSAGPKVFSKRDVEFLARATFLDIIEADILHER